MMLTFEFFIFLAMLEIAHLLHQQAEVDAVARAGAEPFDDLRVHYGPFAAAGEGQIFF